jgi:hypothetical protein
MSKSIETNGVPKARDPENPYGPQKSWACFPSAITRPVFSMSKDDPPAVLSVVGRFESSGVDGIHRE